jgi:serine/threonine protein kinase
MGLVLKIGQALGAYQVLAKLGEGGMGVVYRARDTRLKRDVALKVLPEEFAADRDRLARFEREAQSLAALNHPHIAHVYGLEHWENTRVIAMELAEGETLDRRIARGPVSVSETIAIAIQLSQALEAAHDRGIIHRDLKPSNIKVDDQGAVKVLDFGLAKAFGAEPPETVANSPTITSRAMTHAGVILGTAAYMSPEQARGRVADKRADIWAFGCVVFEMLTAQRLFDGATISDTLAAVLREDIPWNQLPADTPDTFRQLLHRCLDRDPRTRLRDIGEARITLERALHDPATAHHDSESRPRSWLSTAVWIAALIAAGAAGYFAPRSDTTASNAPAPFRTHAAVSIPGEPIIDAAIAPDGTALVYSRANSLWLQRFSDWKAQPIAQTENGRRAFWSPDGQWLAYFAGRQLFRVPVSGGSPVAICELPTSTAVSIASARGAWREDGTIVMANGDGPVLSVDSKGGTLSVFQSPVAGVLDYHDPAVLPDRDELVVTLHRSSGVDTIAVIENGTVKPLVQVPDGGVGGVVYSPTGHLLYHRTALAGAQVWAVGFSPRRLTTTGTPFPIGAGLQPTVARDGTLAMIAVGDPTSHETVWVNADGQKGATIAAPTPWRDGLNFSNDGRLLALVNSSGISRSIWNRACARDSPPTRLIRPRSGWAMATASPLRGSPTAPPRCSSSAPMPPLTSS